VAGDQPGIRCCRGRTTVISVAAKSSPVHSTGCQGSLGERVSEAVAELSPAGCRPWHQPGEGVLEVYRKFFAPRLAEDDRHGR
jgi:hypothetical protein